MTKIHKRINNIQVNNIMNRLKAYTFDIIIMTIIYIILVL